MKHTGLSFLLNISMPIFSNGTQVNAAKEAQWSIKIKDKDLKGELSVTNVGSTTFVITDLKLSNKSDFKDSSIHYVLPGAHYLWQIPLKPINSNIVRLNYNLSTKEQEVDLIIKDVKNQTNQYDLW